MVLTGQGLERDRCDAGREHAECLRSLGQPDQVQQRHARHHPDRRIQRVADRLGAVRGGGAGRGLVGAGVGRPWADFREQPPPDSGGLEPRPHEAHREEPQAFALEGRGKGDDLVASATTCCVGLDGHDEAFRVGRLEVGIQAQERTGLGLEVGLVQPPRVVVDAIRARSRCRSRARPGGRAGR